MLQFIHPWWKPILLYSPILEDNSSTMFPCSSQTVKLWESQKKNTLHKYYSLMALPQQYYLHFPLGLHHLYYVLLHLPPPVFRLLFPSCLLPLHEIHHPRRLSCCLSHCFHPLGEKPLGYRLCGVTNDWGPLSDQALGQDSLLGTSHPGDSLVSEHSEK